MFFFFLIVPLQWILAESIDSLSQINENNTELQLSDLLVSIVSFWSFLYATYFMSSEELSLKLSYKVCFGWCTLTNILLRGTWIMNLRDKQCKENFDCEGFFKSLFYLLKTLYVGCTYQSFPYILNSPLSFKLNRFPHILRTALLFLEVILRHGRFGVGA